MNTKTLNTLGYFTVLERLSKYAAFSAGAALALELRPSTNLDEARHWQQETTEARQLLVVKTDVTIGGARDVRAAAQSAAKGAMLEPSELQDVKNTLVAGRTLRRILVKLANQFPQLAFLASGITELPSVVDAISSTIDERGEVLDSASEKLANIRRELRVTHDRLLQKLQRLLSDPRNGPYLQEAIITQRDGRYVIPIKADFKGRMRGIVHDQSASGATLFIEPLSTVDLNNAWREQQLAEQQEIRRILTALSGLIGEEAEGIVLTVEALANLDLAFAKAKYADELHGSEPILAAFRPVAPEPPPAPEAQPASDSPALAATAAPNAARRHPGSTIKLRAARHPLLNPETVVPVDVEMDASTYALVITGPNTGGKTVGLKTIGLLTMMAQSGLHLPVQSGSAVSVFDKVFADIGDEQSIEQSLSTFSAHITNIIQILGEADDKSLVILDELGAGTDPGEGSALARAILSYLLDMGATTLVATHYPELKGYAHTTTGVRNASVEFDLETLAPTYHLTIGLPGRSNAFAIAARLGLDPTIITEARTMVTQTDLAVEQLLDEIHQQRDVIRRERERAERARTDSENRSAKLARRLENIENERKSVLEQARRQGQKELDALREDIEEMKRRLRSARAAPQEASAAQEVIQAVEEKVEEAEIQQALPVAPKMPVKTETGKTRAIRLGDTVKLKKLNTIGVVTALAVSEAEVQVGRMRVRAKLDELELRGSPEPSETAAEEAAQQVDTPAPASPGLELDIRGKTVEEALPELERYLDAAYLAGLPWVRIIHGKGTGKLRQGVRDFLRSNSQVKSLSAGEDSEGGEGVTVAKLAAAD
jgi:DNA mismatch repair protein MutS2